eukprot:TRINITY_DN11005_c0_g1_i2.p1 TRINITY_DN11005_c0_g1~~TRINITY_DN11005_c0_g1_i2.p1  ORF type:complete len:167 (-),score=0.43 TRINITY_DN11005_c0_g1_i2:121-621(-)
MKQTSRPTVDYIAKGTLNLHFLQRFHGKINILDKFGNPTSGLPKNLLRVLSDTSRKQSRYQHVQRYCTPQCMASQRSGRKRRGTCEKFGRGRFRQVGLRCIENTKWQRKIKPDFAEPALSPASNYIADCSTGMERMTSRRSVPGSSPKSSTFNGIARSIMKLPTIT